LKQELGIAIVQRANHRFGGFTPEGARVLLWAQRLLDDYEHLRQETISFKVAVHTIKLM